MDVRQVRHFLAIVDTGSVHAAASRLLVAQPSVSQTLRRLERELGTELFQRTGRRLVLTPAGRALIQPARDLIRALEVARSAVESAEGVMSGRLTISSMPSQAVHPLPALIGRFRRAHPAVSVGISTARTPAEVCQAVEDGSADVGLLAVSNGPLRDATVRIQPLYVQGYVIVARDPSGLPPGQGPVRVDELTDLDLVVGQPGTGMRRVADSIPSPTGCHVVAQVEHREALLPLVLAGLGVAIVADSWRDMALAAGLTVREVTTDETLHVSLVVPLSFVGPAAQRFCTMAANAGIDNQ